MLRLSLNNSENNHQVEMRLLSGFLALQAIKANPGITIELELCTDRNSETGVRKFAETTERRGLQTFWSSESKSVYIST